MSISFFISEFSVFNCIAKSFIIESIPIKSIILFTQLTDKSFIEILFSEKFEIKFCIIIFTKDFKFNPGDKASRNVETNLILNLTIFLFPSTKHDFII